MEQLTLNLQPQLTPKVILIQRAIMTLFGVINLVLATFQEGSFIYINFAVAFLAFFFAIFYKQLAKPKILSFDHEGFEGPIGSSKHLRIQWHEVSLIKTSTLKWTFSTLSGKQYKIDLSNIDHHDHQQTKQQVLDLARSKGIKVQGA